MQHVTRRFGNFVAVNDVSFTVARGKIFGLLGANGAGKSTTFRMLCGLLPPSEGTLQVDGFDLRRAAAPARGRIGYMAQKFSLYGDLSVRQNLRFFSSAYRLSGARQRERIDWAETEFDLGPDARCHRARPATRLQAAARACLRANARTGHPVPGRTDFRCRSAGTAGVLATHQRAGGERGYSPCDDAFYGGGGVLRSAGDHGAGTHPSCRRAGNDQSHRAHFGTARSDHGRRIHRGDQIGRRAGGGGMNTASFRRLRGLLRKEFLQILRDPSSLAIAFVLPAVLLLIFGDGVSLDARNVPLALVVERPDTLTASFTSQFELSPFFRPRRFFSIQAAERAMAAREVEGIIWLPSNFTRRAASGGNSPIGVIVNGADANNARIVEGYLQQVWANWLVAQARAAGRPSPLPLAAEPQVRFNPAVSSRNYLVPGLIAVIMTLTGALLTALVIAREWERGTMEALMVTRVTMREILVAKLIPYFLLGMGGMAASVAIAVFLFDVPLRGSIAGAHRRIGLIHASGAGDGTADLEFCT